MTGWHVRRRASTPSTPGAPATARATVAVTLLALLLVAAVPVALLAAVVMMMVGYVIGGLAVLGGSVLAAVLAVALAGMTGMHQLRKLLSPDNFRVVRLNPSEYTDTPGPADSAYPNLVQLDRSEYTEVS
jgi:hypothetical protein